MRGLEDRVAADVIDISAGRDADAADLRGKRVAEVVAVEVQRRDHVEIRRAREHLLERDIGDGVLDHNARAGLALRNFAPRAAVNFHRAEFILREFVRPVAERALGKFHDVALVDDREALALLLDGVFQRSAHEPLGAGLRDGLDADADGLRRVMCETDLLVFLREILSEEFESLHGLLAAGLEINPGVNVLGVLTENHHLHFLRMLHRGRHAGEPLHGAQAHIEIEHLAQRDIQRADAAADRRRERPLDADEKFLERSDGVIGQPRIESLERFLACEDFHPGDLAGAAVRLFHRRIEDAHARSPDVRPGAVAADERDDRMIGDGQLAALDGHFFAGGNGAGLVWHEVFFFEIGARENAQNIREVERALRFRAAPGWIKSRAESSHLSDAWEQR